MNQDEQNLSTLAVCHYVFGALVMLAACIPLIHVALGVAMLSGTFDGKDAPPAMLGWMFVGIGSFCILLGWTLGILIIAAGKRLRAHVSRSFCIVIAAICCTFVPLGTALGIFTIVTLTKESVQQLFAANSQ